MTIRELVTRLSFQYNPAGLNQYNQGVAQAKVGTSGMMQALLKANAIQGIVTKAARATWDWLTEGIIGATGAVQGYKTTIGHLVGDVEKANKVINELDFSNASDYYGTDATVGNLQAMALQGMDIEESADLLQRLGEVAGGSSEKYASLAANMGQVFAKGKADGMDLKQFTAANLSVTTELAKMTGKSVEQIEKEGVTYEQVLSVLKNVTDEGGKFNGLLEKQASTTIPGILKRFEALKNTINNMIGDNIAPQLMEILRYILDIGKGMQDVFVAKGTAMFKALIDGFWRVVIMIKLFRFWIEEQGSAFDPLRNAAGNAVRWIKDRLKAALPMLKEFGEWFLTAANNISAFLAPVLEEIGKKLDGFFDIASKVFDFFTPEADKAAESSRKWGERIAGLIAPALILAGAIKAVTLGMAAFKIFKTARDTILLFTSAQRLATAAAYGNGVAMAAVKAKAIAMAAGTKIAAAAQWLLNAAMAANPVMLIVIGVIALIATLVLLYKKCEPFREFVDMLWGKIKDFFANIPVIFAGAIEVVKAILEKLRQYWDIIWSVISGVVKTAIDIWLILFQNIFGTIIEIIMGFADFWVGFFQTLFTDPTKLFDYLKEKALGFFEWIGAKIAHIPEVVKEIIDKIKALIAGVGSKVLKFLGIEEKVDMEAPQKLQEAQSERAKKQEDIDKEKARLKDLETRRDRAVPGAIKDALTKEIEDGNKALKKKEDALKAYDKEVASIQAQADRTTGADLNKGLQDVAKKRTDFNNEIKAEREEIAKLQKYAEDTSLDKATRDALQKQVATKITDLDKKEKKGNEGFDKEERGIENQQRQREQSRAAQTGTPKPKSAVYSAYGTATDQVVSATAGVANKYAVNNNGGNTTTVNASTNIKVDVPPGTSEVQAAAISKQVDKAVQDSLASAINGSRSDIPSPEMRRH
jgi:tape measure domain-containing protein